MSMKIQHKNTGGAIIINSLGNSSKSPNYKVVVWGDNNSSLFMA